MHYYALAIGVLWIIFWLIVFGASMFYFIYSVVVERDMTKQSPEV
jgi:Trk-type K+ transport system membrane component